MKRSFLLLILFVRFFNLWVAADVAEVSCESIEESKWPGFAEKITTCQMKKKTSIDNPETSISTQDTTIRGLSFFTNKNIKFLPLKVAASFPNLVVYSAGKCSIKVISNENFKGLSKLKFLEMANNVIEKISSDTFEDLTALETLGMWNNKIKFIGDETFKKLKKLSDVNLLSNVCIKQRFNDQTKLASMKNVIKETCGTNVDNNYLYLEIEIRKKDEDILRLQNQNKIEVSAKNHYQSEVETTKKLYQELKSLHSKAESDCQTEKVQCQSKVDSVTKIQQELKSLHSQTESDFKTKLNSVKIEHQSELETTKKFYQEMKSQSDAACAAKTISIKKEFEIKLQQKDEVNDKLKEKIDEIGVKNEKFKILADRLKKIFKDYEDDVE